MRASEIVFLAGFAAYVAIRGAFERKVAGQEKVVRRSDGLEVALLVLVGVGSLLLPILHLATPWLAWADRDLPPWAPWAGALVMPGALWLFYRSHADLGLNWSVTLELRAGHALVTQGVYARVRHPMYAAILLFGLAQGLLLPNLLAGWSALASCALLVLVRVPREERMLAEHFPAEWSAYARRSGRLLPRLRPLPPAGGRGSPGA